MSQREIRILVGIVVAGCFIGPVLIITMHLRVPFSPNLCDEIVARKVAYCLGLDASLQAVSYQTSPLLLALLCVGLAAVTLSASRMIGLAGWLIPALIVACFVTGSFLFSPQFLAHFHFRQPSTYYFVTNVAWSLAVSIAIVSVGAWLHYRRRNGRPAILALLGQLCCIALASHSLCSFFYVFDFFVAVE